jgi:hypothetical protein
MMSRQKLGQPFRECVLGGVILRGLVVFLIVMAQSVAFANEISAKPARMVLGWKEYARLDAVGMRLDAKLDTGADNSSINAVNIEEFDKEGVAWVRFDVVNEKGDTKTLERPVERTVRIRQHEDRHEDRRYVVKLTLSLGPLSKEVEVNLVDRSRFSIPLLLGRSFLYPEILVDSGMSYTVN